MSGGAFDYSYARVEQFAFELEMHLDERNEMDNWGGYPNQVSDPVYEKLRAIEAQARRLAKLMREVEWLYSGNTGEEAFLKRVARIEGEPDEIGGGRKGEAE